MSLRDEAITVLRRVEFHLMNDEEGDPFVAAEKVLDALLDWLEENEERIDPDNYHPQILAAIHQLRPDDYAWPERLFFVPGEEPMTKEEVDRYYQRRARERKDSC